MLLQTKAYVDQVVAGLGSRRLIAVIEPDATTIPSCLSTSAETERWSLLKHPIDSLAKQGSWTYLDGGNAGYNEADMAAVLQFAGVAGATGFALNVSNFRSTSDSVQFGDTVSARIGGKHYVIDTSRNGVPLALNDYRWCNPLGMSVGLRPTTQTASSLADAYLWVKPPGHSDGPCNGDPPHGVGALPVPS